MDINETPTIYITTQPTVKEQFVQVGIGVGASLVVTALTLATFAVVGVVYEKMQARKVKKTNTEEV